MKTARIPGRGSSLLLSFLAAVLYFAPMPGLAASTNVNIIDFAFSPAAVTIHLNDTVVWSWVGPTVHTATSDTGVWDSGLLDTPGAKFTHTFSSTGSFPYFCEVHPFMTASVTVQNPPQTNAPPTIAITSPPDGAIFPAPWTGTVQVTDADSDGTVIEIDFKAGTNLLGILLNPPPDASLTVSNLPAGNYIFTAVATDNAGASTTSGAVNIIVTGQTNQAPGLTNVAVQLMSSIAFDLQTGLFEQSVSVTNGTASPVPAVRLSVLGLPPDVVLYDATDSTNGVPFVDFRQALNPGATVAFLLEYYRSNRLEFVSTNFVANAVPLPIPAAPAGTLLQLDRAPFLLNGALVIEFASIPGKTYIVEYSPDMQAWTPAVPPIIAAGTRVQWIDSGPPKTVSAPGGASRRFYRVVQLP